VAWTPRPKIAAQADLRLQMLNAELPADLQNAETTARTNRPLLGQGITASLVTVTDLHTQVYEK